MLMFLALKFAERGLPSGQASRRLLAVGTLAGAGMLIFLAPGFIVLGALYGFLTALAFVTPLNLLKANPTRTC